MDPDEKELVEKTLSLAKLAIIGMLVIGGYLGQSTLVGLI